MKPINCEVLHLYNLMCPMCPTAPLLLRYSHQIALARTDGPSWPLPCRLMQSWVGPSLKMWFRYLQAKKYMRAECDSQALIVYRIQTSRRPRSVEKVCCCHSDAAVSVLFPCNMKMQVYHSRYLHEAATAALSRNVRAHKTRQVVNGQVLVRRATADERPLRRSRSHQPMLAV